MKMLKLLVDGLQERLARGVVVSVEPSFFDRTIQVRFTEPNARLMMVEHVDLREVEDCVEPDGTGWDAYGIHGLDAMLLTVGMMLDPQYDGKRHRIPAPRSGLRLNRRGLYLCDLLVNKWERSREDALDSRGKCLTSTSESR